MDERTSESVKLLYGHSGPVNCLSFSPDKNLLLSCSEDTTGKIEYFLFIIGIVLYLFN